MVRTRDIWGLAESQVTSGVSSELFEEFIFAYQKPVMERFGLTCYGCCEPMDKRFENALKTAQKSVHSICVNTPLEPVVNTRTNPEPAIFPISFVNFPCNTQSIAAKNFLA